MRWHVYTRPGPERLNEVYLCLQETNSAVGAEGSFLVRGQIYSQEDSGSAERRTHKNLASQLAHGQPPQEGNQTRYHKDLAHLPEISGGEGEEGRTEGGRKLISKYKYLLCK